MATFLRTNRSQLYGKLIILLILFGAFFLSGYALAYLGFNSAAAFFLLFGFLISLLFIVFNLVQLIYLPINITIEDSGVLTIIFLFRKSRMISTNDMESFNVTQIRTRFSLYDGIIINLKNGKKILLSDFNLNDYLPVKQFLENSAIQFLGKRNFKPISFYRKSI